MSKALKFIGYNLLVVLVVFTSIEFYLGYLLNHPEKISDARLPVFRQYYYDFDRSIYQYDKALATYDPDLFYKLKPGTGTFSNREFEVEATVNSLGLRDDEASLEKPEIIVLGDSQAMGWGVEQEETFAELIEKESGKKVLNAAVSSYGTARQLTLLNQLDLDSTRLLIIQYAANDAGENHHFANNNFVISSHEKYERLCADHRKQRSYYPFKYLVKLTQPLFKQMAGIYEEEKPEVTKSALQAEISNFLFCFGNLLPDNFNGAILILNVNAHQTSGDFATALKATFDQINPGWEEKKETIVIDPSEVLTEAHYFRLDDHLNAQGHQVLANKILKEIKQTGI